MKTINAYLKELNSLIKMLGGDKDLLEEYSIHLKAEFEDYVTNRPEISMEDFRIEEEFVKQLESPQKIAYSLLGKEPRDFGIFSPVLNWYKTHILSKRGGFELTLFLLLLIPGIIHFVNSSYYVILAFPPINSLQKSFFLFRGLYEFIFSISSAMASFVLIYEINFEIYVFNPVGFPAQGYISITFVLLFFIFLLYVNFQDSLKRTLGTLVVGSFSLTTGLLSVRFLHEYTIYLIINPHSTFREFFSSNLIGYFFLLGATISIGYVISILLFLYRKYSGKTFTGSYRVLDEVISDKEAFFLHSLIFAILVMSPKILTAFGHQTFLLIPEFILILLFFFGMIIFQFWAYPFRFAVKTVVFMIIILFIFWLSISMSLGLVVSLVMTIYLLYFSSRYLKTPVL
ncbi:MAG: hypothetical protein ACXADY_09590 [Candidatus Hodarchaeales archaeon]|jgi:hypothetical protein